MDVGTSSRRSRAATESSFEPPDRYHANYYLKVSVSSARSDAPGTRVIREFRTSRNWLGWGGIGGAGANNK